MFGGGPLSSQTGDKLASAGVRLADAYGCTEVGPVAHPFCAFDADPNDPEAKTIADWQWHQLPPKTSPRWDPPGDGTYELQFLVRLSCCCTMYPVVYFTADYRRPPAECRKSDRYERVRHVRFVGATSNQETSMANVSRVTCL